jgi:hypothetical protein
MTRGVVRLADVARAAGVHLATGGVESLGDRERGERRAAG